MVHHYDEETKVEVEATVTPHPDGAVSKDEATAAEALTAMAVALEKSVERSPSFEAAPEPQTPRKQPTLELPRKTVAFPSPPFAPAQSPVRLPYVRPPPPPPPMDDVPIKELAISLLGAFVLGAVTAFSISYLSKSRVSDA